MSTEPHPTPEPDEWEAGTRLAMRVLVVDDNRDAADLTAALLAMHGADVEACYDGRDALARIAGLRPDACILDVNMPGLDGLCLAECILVAAGARPLLVALTGHDDDDTRRRIADGAFDLHLVKPADPTELVRALGRHMARTRGQE